MLPLAVAVAAALLLTVAAVAARVPGTAFRSSGYATVTPPKAKPKTKQKSGPKCKTARQKKTRACRAQAKKKKLKQCKVKKQRRKGKCKRVRRATARISIRSSVPVDPTAPAGAFRAWPSSGVPIRLSSGRHVFPIDGEASFSDSFGAPRQNVSWHHGADIFAARGTPIVAVTAGTVSKVGWNSIGGNRLWLTDRSGDEFYYAHLVAFVRGLSDGDRVRPGQVLGFVGNTGDAAGTPYHLHFEIHPVSRLYLGYDGAVNPTRYLESWPTLDVLRKQRRASR